MPGARIHAQRQALTRDFVALVAADDNAAAIADALGIQRLPVAAFEDVDALLEHDESPAIVVVCAIGAAASLQALIEPLARHLAHAPIVVIGTGLQRRAIRAALAAGASGVVLHDELESALGPCLLAVRAGQVCVPRRSWREVEPPALSSREKQVLGLVVMGYMNSQIAAQLFLAESTVKSHLTSAFDKLGVRSRHEAVARILDPNGGLGVGILTLGGEPLEAAAVESS